MDARRYVRWLRGPWTTRPAPRSASPVLFVLKGDAQASGRPPSFGPEYPAALVGPNGERHTLVSESRWTRTYQHSSLPSVVRVSRLLDQSARISFEEISREWRAWSRTDQVEFCGGCHALAGQPDCAGILSLILAAGDHEHWGAIALTVTQVFGPEEAFALLSPALASTPLHCHCANLLHALRMTAHPKVIEASHARLDLLWTELMPQLDTPASEALALAAISLAEHIRAAGGTLEQHRLRLLAAHPSVRVRQALAECISEAG